MKIVLLAGILVWSVVAVLGQSKKETPYLVVVSMDGFRWDYPDSFFTPNLAEIAAKGVKARSIIPSFPSVTFPNHYTLATGLYPDHHGLVNNTFYDPDLKLTYKVGDRTKVEDGRFYGGEPIWVAAEKQNVKTACFYWVGSETEIRGVRPSYWKIYSNSIPFRQRVDTVAHWLQLPEAVRPHLVMLYFDQPDKVGHETGPFSAETRKEVSELDELMKYLTVRLSGLPIGKKINIIITSDHGMGAVSSSRRILLDNYIPRNWCQKINGGNPITMIDPVSGYEDSILVRLSSAPHLNVWRKGEVPARLHFGTNPRVGKIVVLADSSYSIGWNGEAFSNAGAHGYDNRNTDMHAIFYAVGPAFKRGYSRASFENVNLNPLMSLILGVKAEKNDGDIESVRDILKRE